MNGKHAVFFMMMVTAAQSPVFAERAALVQEPSFVSSGPSGAVVKKTVRKLSLKRNPPRFGTASWYSETDPFINKHTANGEVFDDSKLTCASWDYPFGTKLEVTNVKNGKSVVCRVNDRGPSKRLERLIDLSKASFKKIADTRKGLVRVSVRVVRTA